MDLAKATLTMVNEKGDPVDRNGNVVSNTSDAFQVEVAFNPQQLQVSYRGYGSTSPKGQGSQSGSSSGSGGNGLPKNRSSQSTGYTSALSTTLLFDTSDSGEDVRHKTLDIVRMFHQWDKEQSSTSNKNEAPRARFHWGTFLYQGRITGLNETLEYFSQDGVPLRATLILNMTSEQIDEIESNENNASAGSASGGGPSPGSRPLTVTQAGDTVQDLAARAGRDWKQVARANGIDNPRQIQAGTVIDV